MDTKLSNQSHDLELCRGAVPEVRVPTLPIVEHLDVIEQVPPGLRSCGVVPMMNPILFQRREETLRHRVVVTVPLAAHAADQPVFFQQGPVIPAGVLLPRSEWWSSPRGGRRRVKAIRNASRANSRVIRELIAQPTTAREKRSRRTARYIHPSRVGMYVMSATHTRLGATASKWRSKRFGATGKEWAESVVVGRNFRRYRGFIPWIRIRRATRCFPHEIPWS